MLTIPDRAGPHDPLPQSSARRPNSLRRTSSIDSTRPEGLGGDVTIDARARDLRTNGLGAASHPTEARLTATVDAGRNLISASSDPTVDGFEDLVGAPVGGGWRSRAGVALPIDSRRHPLLNLLVDDLPGASLVSGVAMQAAQPSFAAGSDLRAYTLAAADICAGWVSDGSILGAVQEHGQIPMPVGPPAPTIERPDDPDGWHEMIPLPPHGTRRRRLLDLWPEPGAGSTHAFEAHFRDSHTDRDGLERVVHEYVVLGRLDEPTLAFADVAAQARVLPWVECPNALASAGRLIGTPIGDLRSRVRTEFTGVSTCTHLNDTLRTLADIEPLLG